MLWKGAVLEKLHTAVYISKNALNAHKKIKNSLGRKNASVLVLLVFFCNEINPARKHIARGIANRRHCVHTDTLSQSCNKSQKFSFSKIWNSGRKDCRKNNMINKRNQGLSHFTDIPSVEKNTSHTTVELRTAVRLYQYDIFSLFFIANLQIC